MIAVGRIAKSVGLKGELSVSILTDDPGRFAKLRAVWIGTDESIAERHTLVSMRTARAAVVLKLKEIESRSAADDRRGQFIFIAETDATKPKKGSYFIHDVIGMKVVTEAGDDIGTVLEVMKLPANDVWVVSRGKNEVLLPAIKEVIRTVDVLRRTVVIRPLEGLLD